MHSKRKRENEVKNRGPVLASESKRDKTQPENVGWLRKLLDWISKGTAESNMSTTSCPT